MCWVCSLCTTLCLFVCIVCVVCVIWVECVCCFNNLCGVSVCCVCCVYQFIWRDGGGGGKVLGVVCVMSVVFVGMCCVWLCGLCVFEVCVMFVVLRVVGVVGDVLLLCCVLCECVGHVLCAVIPVIVVHVV